MRLHRIRQRRTKNSKLIRLLSSRQGQLCTEISTPRHQHSQYAGLPPVEYRPQSLVQQPAILRLCALTLGPPICNKPRMYSVCVVLLLVPRQQSREPGCNVFSNRLYQGAKVLAKVNRLPLQTLRSLSDAVQTQLFSQQNRSFAEKCPRHTGRHKACQRSGY